MNTSFEAILVALNANNGMALDDHRDDKSLLKIVAIARLGKNVISLMDADYAAYYSINSMYVDKDGKPHVSTYSVGVMYPEYLLGTLEEAVRQYNSPEAHTPGLDYQKLTDLTYVGAKGVDLFHAAVTALRCNYGWAVNDVRAKQVEAYDKSPIKITAVASVNGKPVAIGLSGGVNYVRELTVADDGTVHFTDNVLERNHSVGEVATAEEFFSRYAELSDKALSFDEIVYLDKEALAA